MTSFDSAPSDSVRPRLLRQWVLLLNGPMVWALHFFVVYLFTEAVCALGEAPTSNGMSPTAITVLVATVLGVAACMWSVAGAWKMWRADTDDAGVDGFMGRAGIMLGSVFAGAILFVGLPALVLSPC
jgi:hypothetical protein